MTMSMLEVNAMLALKPFAKFLKDDDHDLSINPDSMIFASFNNQETGDTIADLSIEDLRRAWQAFSDLAAVAVFEDGNNAVPGVAHTTLREANAARQKEWDTGNQIDLAFRGLEAAGETGEAIERIYDLLLQLSIKSGRLSNTLKKLRREQMGIKGSRSTVDQAAEELADIVITADLVAMDLGINLMGSAVPDKFNATSEKVGLMTRLRKEVPNV